MENNNQHKITKIKLGITHGDINGISYEIILKAFKDPRMLEFFTPIIYGSPKVAAYYKKVLKLSQVQLNHIKTPERADPDAINIINCVDSKVRVEIGIPTEISGKAAIDALKAAVNDLKKGLIDALVTAPISKQATFSKDFEFHGHTWYLAKEFQAQDVLMLMVHEDLRIAVATDHIPLSQVAQTLTPELILSKLQLMDKSLRTDFSIEKPIIAVLSLNPHAGDNGLIGDEEERIIKPAIEQAKDQGLMVIGPYPADGFFASENYKNFHGILAMYHDQGLIPFKILSHGQGVNYTAGLPIIRTSPAHGTAYDIAGLNKADPTAFINAMFLARTIYKNRKKFEGIKPLEKQNMEELLPTLMPAKTSELQEMEAIQQEDEQDNVDLQAPPQPTAEQEPAPSPEPEKAAEEQPAQPQTEEQPETEQPQVITADHPDVELETVEIQETEPQEITQPSESQQAKPQQQNQQTNPEPDKQHRHSKHQRKNFLKSRKNNLRDYNDLT